MLRTRLFTIALAWTALLSAAPPLRQGITHEDVWLMQRVGAPVASPDGAWAVFSVTSPSYDAKAQSSDLWLKSLGDDRPARQLTFTKGAEGGVAWAPDSRRLAFTAKREGDEAAQIYVLDLAGGEAQRFTTLTLGASSPKWSPDGTRILFTSTVYPGLADEAALAKEAKARKDRKSTALTYDRYPVRHWDHWLADTQPSLFVMEARAGAKPTNLLAGSAFMQAPGHGGAWEFGGFTLEGHWTPDGQGVLFTSTTNLHQAAFAHVASQLFLVAAQGGEPRRLTTAPREHWAPAFTPDGKALLCLTSPVDDAAFHNGQLTRFPWPFVEQPTVLTATLDRAVGKFAVRGDRVWFTYEHAGLEQLHSLPLAGGAVRDEPGSATGCIGALSAGGSRLVGLWESATQPPEVVAFGPAGLQPLTHFNAERTARLDWQGVEHIWTTTKEGRKLHSLLVKPAGFDSAKKYPLFVVIHGGAAAMWRDVFVVRWNYHLLAQPGYVVLLTDYRGSSGYGEAFGQAIQLDPLKGPAEDVNAAADDVLQRFSFLDGTRQAAAGASYGGHLANWLQATTTRYKAIVSHAGEMDMALQWGASDGGYSRELMNGGPVWGTSKVWRDQSPVYQGGNQALGTGFKTPILISVGELDYRVPVPNALMNYALQQRLQVPSRLVVFPDENHWILKGENSRAWYLEVQGWLAKWLK